MPASLELVRIALQAYGNGDIEIALALSDPLIRWDERASRPDGDLVWGHDDVSRAMRRYIDGWEQYSFEVEDIVEVSPGKVVAICRERGVDADGAAIDRRFGGLWVVQAAKIASWSTFLSPKEAIRAARELGGGGFQQPKQRPPAAKPSKAAAAAAEPEEEQTPAPLSEEQRRAAKARAVLRRQAGNPATPRS